MGNKGDNMHPNSLANLKGNSWTPETARESQKRSVASRKANKEAREALKWSVKDWTKYREEVLEEGNIGAIDVLRLLMHKALEQEDFATAADLAKSLSEYEKPKLARIDTKTEEVKADRLTDKELEEMLKQYAKTS